MTIPDSTQPTRRDDHLTDAELNELVDGTLSGRESEHVLAHLAGCADCDERYRTLLATVSTLRSTPDLMPRRTFQLSAEQATLPEPAPGRFDRFAEWIVPGASVIRTATLVVALLLLSITTIDLITHRGDNHESAGPVLMAESGTLLQSTALTGSEHPAAAPMLSEAEISSTEVPAEENAPVLRAAESASDMAESSPALQSAMAPAPMENASPVPSVSPAPPAQADDAGERSGGATISRWRIAELGLLMLLLWLAVSWIGRTRVGNQSETDESDSD